MSDDADKATPDVADLRLRAERGDAYAQWYLGWAYDNGRGVAQDPELAAAWWRRAAEQGRADAQFRLGVAYENGFGVPQDYAEAAAWYRKAAEQGRGLARKQSLMPSARRQARLR